MVDSEDIVKALAIVFTVQPMACSYLLRACLHKFRDWSLDLGVNLSSSVPQPKVGVVGADQFSGAIISLAMSLPGVLIGGSIALAGATPFAGGYMACGVAVGFSLAYPLNIYYAQERLAISNEGQDTALLGSNQRSTGGVLRSPVVIAAALTLLVIAGLSAMLVKSIVSERRAFEQRIGSFAVSAVRDISQDWSSSVYRRYASDEFQHNGGMREATTFLAKWSSEFGRMVRAGQPTFGESKSNSRSSIGKQTEVQVRFLAQFEKNEAIVVCYVRERNEMKVIGLELIGKPKVNSP